MEGANMVEVVVRVNGRDHRLRVDPRATLLETLRERLGLTGTKKGCDRGQCGACTVRVGDRLALSCLTLAVAAGDEPVTTIEGLAADAPDDGELHPVQRAFLDHDGLQCGFCTPGQIMSASWLADAARADKGSPADDTAIREFMSGNLCRCGAYPGIVAAVRTALVSGGGN